jgi:hypothetical protein
MFINMLRNKQHHHSEKIGNRDCLHTGAIVVTDDIKVNVVKTMFTNFFRLCLVITRRLTNCLTFHRFFANHLLHHHKLRVPLGNYSSHTQRHGFSVSNNEASNEL